MTNKRKLFAVFTGGTVVFLIVIGFFIIQQRASIYRYDVTQDYQYSFAQSNATITQLLFQDNRLLLPQHSSANLTSFIKLTVKANLSGYLFQPSITIRANNKSIQQYFERGAQGSRYINISELSRSDQQLLILEGQHVAIDAQMIDLISFSNNDIAQKKILIISPHPDDAEIAAYGLYSRYNKNSFIVTITAGEAGDNKYDELYDHNDKHFSEKGYLKKGVLRTWDSLTVPLLAGVPAENMVNLGFFDGTLTTMYQDQQAQVSSIHAKVSDIDTFRKQNSSPLSKGLVGGADWPSLVANLEYLLQEIQPDIIVTAHPLLDSHRDHQLSSIALFSALKNTGQKTGELFFYTNHFTLNESYPEGESGSVVSLPANSSQSTYFDHLYSFPLSTDKQTDKLLALEAMHDLRLDSEWRYPPELVRLAIVAVGNEVLGKNTSYFRRAVRSNELFLVVKVENIFNEQILKRITGT